MEDFHEYEGLFSTWMNLLTPDELKQIKLKKYELQRIFPDVKKSFIDEMAQHKMLELMSHVPMDQWPAIESVDQDLQQTKEKVVQVNARLEELQDQLEDVILSAQMNYHETKTRLTSLEAKMAEASEKRALLEEKEAKHLQAICKMDERNIPSEKFKDHLQQQRITLSKIEPCKKETEAVMASLKEEIGRLREECSARENTILELKNYVTMKEMEKQERDKEFTEKSQWLSTMLTTIVNLSGTEVLHSTDDIVIVRMKSLQNPRVSAKLTLKFETRNSHGRAMSAAEVDLPDIDISEAVSRSVAANDPADLITSIQEMLNNHAPLIQEVDQLRSEYAVDYLHDEGVLKLMMGAKGQIICTLKIEPGYPHSGSVKLTALEGVQTNKSLDEYKPLSENVRLTDWVEYLQREIQTS